MPRHHIRHRTTYVFDRPVRGCGIEARLTPRSLPHQHPDPWEILVQPAPAWSRTSRDAHGNRVFHAGVDAASDTLTIASRGTVTLTPPARPLLPMIPWQAVVHRLRSEDAGVEEARAFLSSSPLVPIGPDLMAYAAPSFAVGAPLLDAVSDLAGRIRADFVHDRGATSSQTSAVAALRLRRGVCQDLAHVAIGCLRARGLAARYVGGYLAGGAADAHAWASVLVPEWGWVDVDPSLGGFAGPEHITVAWGRDFQDASPVRGTFRGDAAHRVEVHIDVDARS